MATLITFCVPHHRVSPIIYPGLVILVTLFPLLCSSVTLPSAESLLNGNQTFDRDDSVDNSSTVPLNNGTSSNPHDDMYKAISILQELFFPQWIQLLKEENVIDTPDATTVVAATTATTGAATVLSRLAGSSTTATATAALLQASTTPPSTPSPTITTASAANELFFYNITQLDVLENASLYASTLNASLSDTTAFPTAPSVDDNSTRHFLWSDDMLRLSAETVAQLLRNITFLPALTTFSYDSPFWNDSAASANYSLEACLSGDCTGQRSDFDKNYWALFLLVFPVLTIFGNALVILSVFRERSLQTATNYFIVSLACADLFVAAGVMPFAVYIEVNQNHWDLGDTICDTWMASDVIASTCSIFNLTAISIDRFIAVTRPIKYARHKNHRRVVYTICIVWLVSCGIGLPIILGLNHPGNGAERSTEMCVFYNSDFIIYSSLSSFYIPCLLMIILYYQIFRAIRQRAKRAASKKVHHTAHAPPTGPLKDHHTNHHNHKSGAIPLVDARWNGANDSLNKHRLSVSTGQSNNNHIKGHSTIEGATNASSSFLVEGDDIEDIDQDSGVRGYTPPDQKTAGNTPLTEDGPKALSFDLPRKESLVSPDPDDEVLSPDAYVEDLTEQKTSSFRKTANLLSSALSSTRRRQEKPALENGNANLLGPYHAKGGPFRSKNQLRRSMKTREKLLAKRERKATKTLAIVLGVFLACWVPFFTANIVNAICVKLQMTPPGATVFMVTTWLGYGNSFMNPVIYTVFNEEFRKAFLQILRCQTKYNS